MRHSWVSLGGAIYLGLCVYAAAQPATLSETHTTMVGRELAPIDNGAISSILQPVRISLKYLIESPSAGATNGILSQWLSWMGLGGAPASKQPRHLEIVAHPKSGASVVVDRISVDPDMSLPVIVDVLGSTVGYFRHAVTKEGVFHSARGSFIIYFSAPNSLITSTGEWRCAKVDSAGQPKVEFSNARWLEDDRALHVDVRSSCGMVEFFGGAAGTKLLNLTRLDFKTALDANDRAGTQEGARFRVGFTPSGEPWSIEKDNPDSLAIRKCLADAKSLPGFKVCGPDANMVYTAVWKGENETIEGEIGCGGGRGPAIFDQRQNYLVSACETKPEGTGKLILDFEIAHRELSGIFAFRIDCDCLELAPSRFHVDMHQRTISFNLRADTAMVRFEGSNLHLRAPALEAATENSAIALPVVYVRFNENWQIGNVVASHSAEATSTIPGRDSSK